MTLRVNHFLTGYLYSLLLRKTEACMKLISRRDRERLIEKGRERRSLSTRDKSLPYSLGSPRISPGDSVFLPVVLLRSPDKSTLWLLTDIHEFNHDRAYGLRYTACGAPVISYFSLSELAAIRGKWRRRVVQVRGFRPNKSLRAYASELQANGCIAPQNLPALRGHAPQPLSQS